MKRVVFSVLLVNIIFFSVHAAKKNEKKEEKPVPVYVEKIKLIDFYEEIKYVTNIHPSRQVEVFSHISGVVENKNFQNGAFVKKGQVIATVKNISPGYDYSLHKIKAPISGVILNFYQEEGTYIQKQNSVFQIADVKSWRVAVPMLQEDINKLSSDYKVFITPHGQTEKIEAKLLRVDPNVNSVLGTTIVEFSFANTKKLGIRLGMISTVQFHHDISKKLGIENKFIKESYRDKKKYIFVINEKDNTLQKRYLETGLVRDGKVQILSGLKEGETVVTKLPRRARSGRKVEVKNKVL